METPARFRPANTAILHRTAGRSDGDKQEHRDELNDLRLGSKRGKVVAVAPNMLLPKIRTSSHIPPKGLFSGGRLQALEEVSGYILFQLDPQTEKKKNSN